MNEVDLAKVEKTVMDGTMPLAKYYLVHWGSSLTKKKSEVLLDWIRDQRAKFYPNPLAAPRICQRERAARTRCGRV